MPTGGALAAQTAILAALVEALETQIAQEILRGFDKHYRLFRHISAGAKQRFEKGDWPAVRSASRERIDMYDLRVAEAVTLLQERFSQVLTDQLWPAVKQAYVALLIEHPQPECAETFFNSVACRLLHRSYFRNQYIFWRPGVSTEHIEASQPTYRCYYPKPRELRTTIKAMIADHALSNVWEDLDRDIEAVLKVLSDFLPQPLKLQSNFQVQVLSSLFYRNHTAYLVGRILNGAERTPFAVPIRHNREGALFLDALLLHRLELGSLFSLARSYFMVEMEVPSAFVAFLQTIFPDKPPAELYIAVGLQKQGKTLFYRDLVAHLKLSSDFFVTAPGVKGMVMMVFTLPSFPYVFKIIRDRFEPPKDVDRQKVIDQYRFVKQHERVGRMADTLEYSNVAFPIGRFEPALLEELEQKASLMLERDGENLIIKHLYIERRMVPFDLFLRDADEKNLRLGLREWGNAVRELARANIFPGDLLFKNFGVTRFGRVVFYDYDEICPLDECVFRKLPTPRTDDEEFAGEPWFYVGTRDIFPEEIPKFLFPNAHTQEIFAEEHPQLFTAQFWQETQRQVASGEEFELIPYPAARRFSHLHR